MQLIIRNLKFLVIGICFGIIFTKSEVISWFRIQEMFQLQSFHMFGVIGTAVITAMLSVWLIKKLQLKTIKGDAINIPKKEFTWGVPIGGTIFGLGWAITGACPGPIFALIGNGFIVAIVILLSAIAGTFVYGLLKEKLPH
jgi:uncharacterized protein